MNALSGFPFSGDNTSDQVSNSSPGFILYQHRQNASVHDTDTDTFATTVLERMSRWQPPSQVEAGWSSSWTIDSAVVDWHGTKTLFGTGKHELNHAQNKFRRATYLSVGEAIFQNHAKR